jgi:hypothetical protein
MHKIFLTEDELLRSQANVTIYFLLVKLALAQGRLADVSRQNLVSFRDRVQQNRLIAEKDVTKADFELLDYDRMTIQGTNDASSIKERLRIMAKFLGIALNLAAFM